MERIESLSRAEQSRAEQLDGCVRLGNVYDDEKFNGGNFGGNVWDKNGIAPTMKVGASASQQCTVDIKCVAMRGRAENNEQQLELNNISCTNTIKSVAKDNFVMETKKIKIRQATKDGFVECEIGGLADLNYPTSNTRRGRVQNGGAISPALTTENIPSVIELGNPEFYNFLYEIDGEIYLIRIRKLTPKECWSLMDFNEGAFDKAKYKTEKLYLEGGVEKCNAKLKVVAENQRQENMETYVLCTTKDLQDMDVMKMVCEEYLKMQESEKIVNVSIATEKSEKMVHLECATNIIKCIDYMGIHFTLMEGKDRSHMDIIAQAKMGSTNTEKFMKITTESNLNQAKLYTILTLIKLITESKIFSASTIQANIEGVIQITTDCEGNILMQLSNLEMEHISELSSNTVLYKQAGNSIVVNCLVGIFGQMFEGKENIYKENTNG